MSILFVFNCLLSPLYHRLRCQTPSSALARAIQIFDRMITFLSPTCILL